MTNLTKVAVYIDGFNLYHALKNLKKPYLKWLNLKSLAEKFIDNQYEIINKIYYFSAIATHLDKSSVIRHQTYIEALQQFEIEFIQGNFKKKCITYKNHSIKLELNKHEEKETDVNLAIYMVRDAIKRSFDKFFIITNDTDILPAIKIAKYENPSLQLKLLTPPTLTAHNSLVKIVQPLKKGKLSAVNHVQLTEGHIRNSLLPEQIIKSNGKIIYIPDSYKKL